MVLRGIVIVAAILQVLQCRASINALNSGTSFDNTALSPTNQLGRVHPAKISNKQETHTAQMEERGFFGFGDDKEDTGPPPSVNDDGTLVVTTPIPGAPPHPSYAEMMEKYGSLLKEFDTNPGSGPDSGSDSDDDDSSTGAGSSAPKAGSPVTKSDSSTASSDKMKKIQALADATGISTSAAPTSATSAAPSSATSAGAGLGASPALTNDDLGAESGLGDVTDEDMEMMKELLGSNLDAGGSMLDMDEFMAKYGAAIDGGGGLGGSMFGGFGLLGDPTQPKNLTVEDDDIILGELYGGKEHGDAFSDVQNIKFGQMFLNISLFGGERVDRVELLTITQETLVTMAHGGKGGQQGFVEPDLTDTITSIEVHWDKNKGKTCIFYMKLTTSKNHFVATGMKTTNSVVITPPKGYRFAGFHGRSNKYGIFCIGAIWTKETASDLNPNDVMALPPQASSDVYAYKTTIRNWVGPVPTAVDGACYQKRFEVSHERLCPSGYNKNNGWCVAQCPLDYPLDCFMECIPQNADCAQTVIAKVGAVLTIVLNAATLGTYGALIAAGRTAKLALTCAISILNAVKSLLFYLRYTQTTIPVTDTEKLMDHAFQLQIVLLDLPLAICSCFGIEIPPRLMFSIFVLSVVSAIVMIAVSIGEALFGSKENVMLMLRESGAMNTSSLSGDTIYLDEFLNNKSTTCGYQIRTLTNRVIGKVMETRNNTPNADIEDVRVAVSKSTILTDDIPIVTNHCMGEIWENKTSAAAFETRNMLRKTLRVIIEQLIEDGTTDMGKELHHKEKVFEYTNMGLFFLAMLDPTGIAWVASEFIQPICGPTMYIGEIDDGTLYNALGLKTMDQAFIGSYGIWKKKGDGSVTIHFESVDKYDVAVVIKIAGEETEEVRVPSNGNITWTSTVEKLQDRTLYLDRWRPGLFGIPGKGGGSLLMWIPRSSEGGKLILHARLNVS
ncbi:Mannose-binding lectin [Plasmopara halstedii]|uniref:Mannose-binding lectin n=1 Tax=Plasmopara halstedii TaxID=4781 RepID=A0A0P1ANX8_PLAHL|nr:Mannose-binding lectin [Plasmopara halstedii]CEG42704.1 Mannose-binding lectin [Plasmopara halstedii]|eukprot:XP_024579073.1 Mannose-binding lectin [Plasmopara halstedii]